MIDLHTKTISIFFSLYFALLLSFANSVAFGILVKPILLVKQIFFIKSEFLKKSSAFFAMSIKWAMIKERKEYFFRMNPVHDMI